jgi:AraC family transcriptional regulator
VEVSLLPAAAYCVRYQPSAVTVGVALQRQAGLHAIGTDRRSLFEAWPGEVSVIGPGVDVYSESTVGGEYLLVKGGCGLMSAAARWVLKADRRVMGLALSLRRHVWLEADDAILEGLVQRLWMQLEALEVHPVLESRGRRPLAKLLSALEGAPDEDWSLRRMADFSELSVSSLTRAFIRSVGVLPHAYLMDLRLHRARALLEHSEVGLAEVAQRCGFSHQSHMGVALKRAIGFTPLELRRRCRGS